MKLLFLLLLCVLILARSARTPSFDVRLHSSSSIPIASFVERGLFIKTFCHRRYLNRRRVYRSGHQGTFNPAVITNKEEVHMVHGNINTNDETSHTTRNAKKRSLKISDFFSKQNGKSSYDMKIYRSRRVLPTGLKLLADNPLDLHNSSYHASCNNCSVIIQRLV